MPKKFVSYLVIFVGLVLIIATIYLAAAPKSVIAPSKNIDITTEKSVSPSFKGNEDAFKNALNLYIQKKQEGVDMESGPCLGQVAEDWVLDVAHNPRVSADDKPQNQCQDYIDGKVKHFIEFDPSGKLIRKQ